MRKSREEGCKVVLARMLVQSHTDQRETKFLSVATRLTVVGRILSGDYEVTMKSGDDVSKRHIQEHSPDDTTSYDVHNPRARW